MSLGLLFGASVGGMLAYEVAGRTGTASAVLATCLLDPTDPSARKAAARFGFLGSPGQTWDSYYRGSTLRDPGRPYAELVKIAVGAGRSQVEVALVAVVAALTSLDAWWNAAGTRSADLRTYLLVAVSIGVLLVRHRRPVLATVVCGAALTGLTVLGHRGELLSLPTMVALYAVAVGGGRRRTALAGVVAVTWSGLLAGLVGGDTSPVAELVWPVAALLLGEVVRGRRELRQEYADRQARAEADREREARNRAQAERLRIAREVHDVVAHTMAGVKVQMGVAAAAFDTRPETTREALRQAHAAVGEALQELRTAVAMLRDESAGGAAYAPLPGLGGLDDLAAATRRVGVAVTLHRPASGFEPPAAVQLTAYRIVQEALTNVVRHARADAAAVSVACDGEMVQVEVIDDGVGGQVGAENRGFGLRGMAERAAALGGRFECGPARGGGFRVYATLPLVGRRS